MGDVRVPARAYYGADPASEGKLSHLGLGVAACPDPRLGLVKFAAATVNRDLGKLGGTGKNKLEAAQIDALLTACREVADGKLDGEFPIDVFQTGSGTSSNMNANEVIANRAIELLGGDRFARKSRSTPTTTSTWGRAPTTCSPRPFTWPWPLPFTATSCRRWHEFREVLADKARQWDDIIKIGRTHLADATPIRLGQEIQRLRPPGRTVDRAGPARPSQAVSELPAGGTAVGTGINTHPQFGRRVAEVLARETGIGFVEAANHFEANASRDGLVECSGQLRAVAVTLFSVANNIRWLGSGPRCGFYEIKLPDRQPGSSIMPGKVNPVMSESMMQVCARVLGNDQTVAFSGATGGNFELNIMMPIMGHAVLESCQLLASAVRAFVEFCAREMEPNREACEAAVEKSLAMVTSLNPHIGYERAAALAKEAFRTGKTIRELCREQKILPDKVLDEALDPRRMTEPH